jgi:CRP/FNR family transcriptional regulator, cyclic AMP receptor protein
VFSHEFAPQAASEEQARTRARMRPSSSAAIQAHFSSVPLFEECSKRELKLLAKSAVVEARAAGATLVTEGQPGSNAFVILQGKCRVTRNGRRVGEVKAGGIVGELSMLNRAPRNATVIAETPLEVAILARRDFVALLDKSPSIQRKLLTSLAARVQELDARTPC